MMLKTAPVHKQQLMSNNNWQEARYTESFPIEFHRAELEHEI